MEQEDREFKWMTSNRLKDVLNKMLKDRPKHYVPYKFIIGNAVPFSKDKYKGVDVEYNSLLEKSKVLLVDEYTYYKMMRNGTRR
jgi:hypothetical protein